MTTLTTDHLGRPVLVVSAKDHEALRAFRTSSWTEISGVAYGYSAAIKPGDELYDLAAGLARADREQIDAAIARGVAWCPVLMVPAPYTEGTVPEGGIGAPHKIYGRDYFRFEG